VDTRSIADVRPADLVGFRQCHFFAGIALWSLSLIKAGWPRGQRVWTASLPCQPWSAAGRGEGAADERHMWPVFFELVRACRPDIILGEQVSSSAVIGAVKQARRVDETTPHVWFDGICTDLEAAHYSTGACVMGAHSVGSPQRRQRLYWMAYSERWPSERWGHDLGATPGGIEEEAWEWQRIWNDTGPSIDNIPLADSSCPGAGAHERYARHERDGHCEDGGVGESIEQGLEGLTGDGDRGVEPGRFCEASSGSVAKAGTANGLAHAGHSTNSTEQGNELQERDSRPGKPSYWDNYGVVQCRDGKSRRIPEGSAESILQCLADEHTEGVDRRWASGCGYPLTGEAIPGRAALLKGIGNAIVPELAAEFIRSVMEVLFIERLNSVQ